MSVLLSMGGSQLAPDSIPAVPGILIGTVLAYLVIRKGWWKP